MENILQFLRKHALSVFFAVFIWIICLIPIPETPLNDVTLIDKWTHISVYLLLCILLWIEVRRDFPILRKWRYALYTTALTLAMGGLIELVQAYCTGGNRSGDWLDFIADGVGILLGQLIGMLLAKCLSSSYKGQQEDGNCRNGGRP